MTKTDEYRAKAEHCRQMADQVISPIDREMWLQLAADWLLMASKFAARTASEPTEH